MSTSYLWVIVSYLSPEQAVICREWIGNNRCLEAVVKKLRVLSLCAAGLQKIPQI